MTLPSRERRSRANSRAVDNAPHASSQLAAQEPLARDENTLAQIEALKDHRNNVYKEIKSSASAAALESILKANLSSTEKLLELKKTTVAKP